jgi:hypothetical protein
MLFQDVKRVSAWWRLGRPGLENLYRTSHYALCDDCYRTRKQQQRRLIGAFTVGFIVLLIVYVLFFRQWQFYP